MNLIFYSIIFFLTSNFSFAENHLLILGGGGEPQTESTIFDNGMKDFSKNLKRSKWKYEISFNGGHSVTENILKKKYSKAITPPTDFTRENFTKLIQSYKNKILSGQIRSGDQLMILINTHGAEKEFQESTHSISLSGGAVTNINTLEGSEKASLDTLQEIVKLTNERGINLGIIDLSCHSGNTLALKKNSTNTCIISASGPLHYGFTGSGSFIENFLSNLNPGISLEEAFLKSRLASVSADYPMISTNENTKIVRDVYDQITPYLYYYAPDEDKMSPYVLINSSSSQLCKREDEFNDLISKIDGLKSVLKPRRNSFNADELKRLLFEYKRSQDDIFKAIEQMGVFNLDKEEFFLISQNSNDFNTRFKTKFTWLEILHSDIDGMSTYSETLIKNSKSETEKQDIQSLKELIKQIKLKKQQILTENPKLLNYQTYVDLKIKAMKNTEELASQIALQEKKFYEELYRRSQTNNPNDPCKRIIF